MTALPTWPHDARLHAWWVTPALLAGEYPGDPDRDAAREKVGLLAEAGVSTIVDLTTPRDHLRPYEGLLPDTITRSEFPIPDRGVIDDAGYDDIVAHIRAEIGSGGRVYVHCWGGVGRTSTVIACVLGADGLSHDQALERIAEARAGTRKGHRRFLESGPQRELVARRLATTA
ncbi:protein-tyrosine phosphatase family protein [Williamsia sp. MIQD14]|uniref:protein-tyrosine phosphatase family protein n=1 Tax=Williamsia sp. MIQD14 TaxID=3425703 RepID=UPI003DA1AB9D